MKRLKSRYSRTAKFLLVLSNVVLLLAVLFFVVYYSASVRLAQEQAERDTFCSAVESMKQLSIRYLENERRYVGDWVAFIEDQDMTMDEALDYLRRTNSQSDRYAHIVDMDTLDARAADYRSTDGDDHIGAYQLFTEWSTIDTNLFVGTMQRMMQGENAVLGKYRIQETQVTVISIGKPVQLRLPDGSHKCYLLLRAIPVDSMKQTWIFPTEYSAAEIGLITKDCDYIIQSTSMRAENFLEFIRAYNFADDRSEEHTSELQSQR